MITTEPTEVRSACDLFPLCLKIRYHVNFLVRQGGNAFSLHPCLRGVGQLIPED